jgi:hypothetical protein
MNIPKLSPDAIQSQKANEKEGVGWIHGTTAREIEEATRTRSMCFFDGIRTNYYSHTHIRGSIVGSGRETVFDLLRYVW